MPDDSIFIEGLTFNCIIGVLPHERHTEQPLRVDIDMAVDVRKSCGDR
ncbi:MAG: dihydroneopterin aldolase [Pseudomonadales bacterium]